MGLVVSADLRVEILSRTILVSGEGDYLSIEAGELCHPRLFLQLRPALQEASGILRGLGADPRFTFRALLKSNGEVFGSIGNREENWLGKTLAGPGVSLKLIPLLKALLRGGFS